MWRTSLRSRTNHPAPLRHVIVVNVSDYYGCSATRLPHRQTIRLVLRLVWVCDCHTQPSFPGFHVDTPSSPFRLQPRTSTQQRSAAPLDIAE